MLTKTLYVLQEYKDIQDNHPWPQNEGDGWNCKHASEAADNIPCKDIKTIPDF